jgi:DNA-binding MurR/RpiR family transcriptional regulator
MMNGSVHDAGDGKAFERDFTARVTFASGEFTANDSRVVEYMRGHLGDLPFLAADELAAMVGVSRAAVVRLAQKLGYARFADLRNDAQRQFRDLGSSPLSRFSSGIAEGDSLTATTLEKFDKDVANLQATATMVADRLPPAARDLAAAPHVFVAGSRNSYSLALYFYHLLHGVRSGARLLDPGFPDEISDLTADDVLVTVLFRRYAEVSVRFLQWAVRRGAKTIAVTDGPAHPFLQGVTHVLPVANNSPVLFQSMAAAVATLEALVAEVAQVAPEETTRMLVAKEQFAAEGGFFYRAPGESRTGSEPQPGRTSQSEEGH